MPKELPPLVSVVVGGAGVDVGICSVTVTVVGSFVVDVGSIIVVGFDSVGVVVVSCWGGMLSVTIRVPLV